MQCAEHPNRIAVDKCSACGNGVCSSCRSSHQTEILCPDCLEKQYGLSHHVSNPDTLAQVASSNIRKKQHLVAFVLIIVLYSVTLWSYLSPWRGGALSISAIASIVVSLVLQLALLWRNSVLAKSAVVIGVGINLILAIFYGLLYIDSSGRLGMSCMIIIVPIVLFITLYDVVSSSTLLGILIAAWTLLAVLLAITCA